MNYDVKVTGRRIVATIIDSFVLSAIGGVVSSVLNLSPDRKELDLTSLASGGSFALFVVAVLYYTILEGILGRTIGKMVTGIRVVSEETGAAPGLLKALIRTVLRIIDAFFGYLLALIIVINSDRRRRLGDMAAKTLVVRV
ncbi:RDD family protein [Catenuloplanes japonicus]|uniref:RDD family protein n=1 Tax=Catenuloplanes japonicus TaxID=33876 RepID=UPI0005253C3E|nr:RDD family protein [Catenuloplanes japonicus]